MGARPDRTERRRVRVRRLDHFGVDVADLARAERFYTEVLGMKTEMHLPDQVLLSYGDGNCALFLRPNREPGGLDQIRNPLGKSHHAFEAAHADLVAAQALFAARGTPVPTPRDRGNHDSP